MKKRSPRGYEQLENLSDSWTHPIYQTHVMRTRPFDRNAVPKTCTKVAVVAMVLAVVLVLHLWRSLTGGETRSPWDISQSVRQCFLDELCTNNVAPSVLVKSTMTKRAPPPPGTTIFTGNKASGPVSPTGGLRLNWTQLNLYSTMAQRIAAHQRTCTNPEAEFRYRNRYGMGSDLYLWTMAMCNGMQQGQRVITARPWVFWDQHNCPSDNHWSSMTCYFFQSEELCPTSNENAEMNTVMTTLDQLRRNNSTNNNTSSTAERYERKLYRGNGRIRNECQTLLQEANMTEHEFAGSAMEFLFSSISSRVVDFAVERLPLVFPPRGIVPPNLITVHIRWGDKYKEMKLVDIASYVNACHRIVQQRHDKIRQAANETWSAHSHEDDNDTVHIFLATEDPTAVQAMRETIPSHWRLYVDPFVTEFSKYRQEGYNGNPQMAQAQEGTPGLASLASLLIAMEANDFVLTTASNWSRLMNDLRRFILEPRYSTSVIDLRPSRRQ